MKKQKEKRGELLKPSPNEEAHILQSERERRKKLRLKQIRDQEKAFSRKVLQDARIRKTKRLQHLTHHLKGQWQDKHDEQEAQLEKLHQENLAEFGLGHMVAAQDKTDYSRQELTEQDRQRATERYKTAMQQMLFDKAKMNEWEMERTKARQRAVEIERHRAARIAALPPPVDPIADVSLTKDQTVADQKDIQSFSSSHFHLHPSIHVERALDLSQEDARLAAKDEEDRLQGIIEDVEREKAEQLEKARLRHKHALALQQLDEDHKKMLKELDSLERHDRHRRQEAVAKIPVRIFQPPHKRLEDADERQRELEQAFEDMYMAETGYTGDVTIALEPSPPHPSQTTPEAIGQSALEGESRGGGSSADVRQASSDLPGSSAVGSDYNNTENVEQQREPRKEPAGGSSVAEPPVVPKQDPLRRLLQTIERQRKQRRIKRPSEEEPQPSSAVTAGIPLAYGPGDMAHRRRQELRIPDTVLFSGDDSATEAESGKEEVEEDQERLGVAVREHHSGAPLPPSDGSSGGRTLLHPLEAAQRSRTTTPADISSSPRLTQQEALLKQQRLKLQLQQKNLLEQQLEQQLQQYQRQLRDTRTHPEAPIETLVPGEEQRTTDKICLEEPLPGGPPVSREPGSESTSHGMALPSVVPGGAPREESPSTNVPESSSLGSVTSETLTEFSSEFRRTLEAARATAERAALSRENESATLRDLSRVPLEYVPFTNSVPPDPSSCSTLSLQSEELRSVLSPSAVSPAGMALSSDLSVTAALSRTSQLQVFSRDFGRSDRPVSGAPSPFYSDIADTARITAAPSLLARTSQNLGLFRTSSSSARTFTALPSGSKLDTRLSRGGVSMDRSGDLGIASSILASSSETAPQISRVSFPSQPSRLTYTPDYLDYYRQKIQEERQLFEAQRNRIRQRQNEQVNRYSDLLNKKTSPAGGPQPYQTMVDVTDSGPPVVPHGRPSLGSIVKNDGNKENQGNLANSTGFHGQEQLENLSRRLDSFEKSLSRGDDSDGSHTSLRSGNAFQRLPSSVSTSSYSSKPSSTSGLSYASTGTDYVSLPRGAARADIQGSTGSTLSSLSELTKMITRLTSTSEDTTEAEENNSSAYAVAGQSIGHNALNNTLRRSAYGPQNVSSESNQSSRVPQGQPSNVPSSVTTSADLRGAADDGAFRSETWYSPPGTVPGLLGAVRLVTSAAGAPSTSGSVGQSQLVPSEASAPFPLGGGEGNALEATGKGEAIASNGDSPFSGHVNSQSVDTSSLTSLSSGTLPSGASGRLDDSLGGSDQREPRSSERSPNSDGSPENPSEVSSLHSDKESIAGVSMRHSPERSDNGVSLQDAFLRRKGEFVKLSKARVQMAKEKRLHVKPRVKVKQIGRRATGNQGRTKSKS